MKIGGYSPVYTKAAKAEIEKPTDDDLAALKHEISEIFGKDSYKQSSQYLKISDDAYEKMLADPEFKDEMLNMLKTEKKYTGNALITTTITAEGWSSDNYASVSKEHKKFLSGILPEYMDIEQFPEVESDKETTPPAKDDTEKYLVQNQYQRTIQEIIEKNLLNKNDLT